MGLDEFLTSNRAEIIDRCRVKVRARRAPRATDGELEHGIPLFLDQLIETFRMQRGKNDDSAGVATRHGGDLLASGFTVAQVVHDYGDVCQAVTDLAIERSAPISNEDFRTFNRCLDDAIADAVTEYARVRDVNVAGASNERLGVFAHEVRNLVHTATIALDLLKSGRIGIVGSTGTVLERSLTRLDSLVARSLAHVRLEAGDLQRERIEVRRLLEDAEITASVSAKAKGILLSITHPASDVAIEGDPQIVAAIIVNILQNAIKYTRPQGHVSVEVSAMTDRVLISVSDECGGLPADFDESQIKPFAKRASDRTGVGLGLIVARRGAMAHGGAVHVRDIPGTGCVFSVELPRAH